MDTFLWILVVCTICGIIANNQEKERKRQEQQIEKERLEREKLIQERKEQQKKLEEEKRKQQQLEKERQAIERLEKKKLELEKQNQERKRIETFYKECSKNKLFQEKNTKNKEKIYELAEKNDLKYDAEKIIKKIYHAESIKNCIFSNYFFIKPIKDLINRVGIYKFICLINNAKLMNKDNGTYFKENVLSFTNTINKNVLQKVFKCILYYGKIVDLIENDEELNKICQNLLKTHNDNKYIDYSYISKKIYDIYYNSYKEKYKIDITKTDFSNVFAIMKAKNIKTDKYSDFYLLINKNYKGAKQFPRKIYDELVLHKREIDFYENIVYEYIIQKRKELSLYEIYNILLNMDEMCSKYEKMVKDEKKQVKEQKEKINELKNKAKIEKERLRLLEGDISTEVILNKKIQQKKIQQKEVEIGYQNVKNGFEFEEYVANLYKKLGYRIEEVTKKSGDQRSRRNSI